MLTHGLSIDVEDWHNGAVLLLSGTVVPPTDAVVHNTHQMLELLERHQTKATFFVLGNVSRAFPQLVRRIAEAGHELGVHGYHHHLVYDMTPEQFRDAARRAKAEVEQASGCEVLGYRAAAASITRASWWALEILAEEGYRYDSSVFPFKGKRYGVADAPLGPHHITTRTGTSLLEIPLTVLQVAGRRLPCCGGGYLRHFPYVYTGAAMRLLEREGRRAVVYLHPYELDAGARPRLIPLGAGWRDRMRMWRLAQMQNRNRGQTAGKLSRLLRQHRFGPLRDAFITELARLGVIAAGGAGVPSPW